MPETTLHWQADALRAQLEPVLPGICVEVVASTPSTNTALLERARGPCAALVDGASVRRSVESAAFARRGFGLGPCLLVAEHQSAGRGRQGRPWRSAAGASLTFSLALPLASGDWSGLSLAVGVALAEALEPAGLGVPRIGLKWPNDLWLMDGRPDGPRSASHVGRKLGGVLIETVSAGAQRLAVIGIGLNVKPFDADAPETGFATLQELDAGIDAPAVLARVALPLARALQRFEQAGFAAFADAFAARDVLLGRAVRTSTPEPMDGIARGVSARGGLLVDTDAGRIDVGSGEVSVRLNAEAPC